MSGIAALNFREGQNIMMQIYLWKKLQKKPTAPYQMWKPYWTIWMQQKYGIKKANKICKKAAREAKDITAMSEIQPFKLSKT